ncbi:hypothetical protein Vadar_013837 [Vaccinium darrowii]|uniref:Uncharacterized protein n=1 Tax=Vaccinium darrowii TaxID=229202 RepID=A0ACB7YDF9_9ERIC|nr:hypothetical protein Vadar_013837 [Vaccinium darrowii]
MRAIALIQVVELLAYIEDKDLFVEFYWKNLSRRLLSDEDANDKHERLMLTKLKKVLFRLTYKMEQMVTDLALSKENQNHFEKYIGSNPNANPGINLTVSVLTRGLWPSYIYKSSDESDLYLPLEMAAALLLVNASDRLSYSEIETRLNMADDVLFRVLESLACACAKYQILNKLPSNKTIPLPPADERERVVEEVTKDRRYAINASIVHIMKSRKVLCLQELVTQCVEQLRLMFKANLKAIKKQIDNLITREYLERDKDNPKLIHYLV